MGHCEPNVFIFATEKGAQITFKQKKLLHYFTLRERIYKPNLSELTQVFCGLLSLLSKYF